ncbi:MAG: MAPEG family protein [Sphingomonadales bacterium]|nr:MAPEG family protein [Sphingomonadales bacterium]
MNTQILAPATVLILWTLVMLVWMAATRLPAMAKMGPAAMAKPGSRGVDLEGVIADRINWKAHNYAHLMEQPTLFYAVVVILAMLGVGSEIAIGLAWTYVASRIVHSLWQASVNTIPIRLAIFAIGSLCLLGLAVIAAMAALS